MELKDKLKQFRKERGLSQAQLAELLFVSRSTVAKWENGLGLPNPESMERLEQEFGISGEDIATSEPETVIVDKNRRLRRWAEMVMILLSFIILALMCLIPYWIEEYDYGLTVEMAAGDFADNEYFDTGDYRIFYNSWPIVDENGLESEYELFEYITPVKKHFWGYTQEAYKVYRVFNGDKKVAFLYTVEGEHGYYNFLRYQPIIDEDGYHYVKLDDNWEGNDFYIDQIYVNSFFGEYGELCEVQKGFFFISSEQVTNLEIGELYLDVDTSFVGWN